MLYPKSKENSLSDDLFKNPTNEYRGTPFWSWNCKLSGDELLWQIDRLKEMGFGGFHMHSRSGMATPYLSDEFAKLVRECTEKAEQEGMYAYLYDEDRWPSGAAGGIVTKNRKYSSRYLMLTVSPKEYCNDFTYAMENGKRYLLAVYDVILNGSGELTSYTRINEGDNAKGTKWYAYTEISQATGWYNNQTYVDTLSKEAIDKFIDVTYDFYNKAVGDKFGTVVPSIFTDEPQHLPKTTLSYAESTEDIFIPWTALYDELFREKYTYSILDKLPELFWELPKGDISQARYHYHDFTTELFTQSYADNCGSRCAKHNLLLTGHVYEENSLFEQTVFIGEAMRTYRKFGIPGVDMLRNQKEYTAAKQAQSTVRQYGKEGMTSELYGVTNWDFDFRGHKFQGDWQAAMGVTVRVPHLSWVSMKGDAKRDYPASINYQSPWYKEYSYVEDHFARVNTALTRGKPIVKVGIIHPIETYWLHYGPKGSTVTVRENLDEKFHDLCSWMLSGLMDFDYISEALLPELCGEAKDTLPVGQMEYSAIIISGCETLRSTTVEILTDYVKRGGKLIIAGAAPSMIDALPSDGLKELISGAVRIEFSKAAILEELKNERMVDIREYDGSRSDKLIYQLREDNDCKWFFTAYMREEEECRNIPVPHKRRIMIKGEYTPLLYNTLNGEIENIEFEIQNGYTIIYYTFYRQSSLLLKLNKASKISCKSEKGNKSIIGRERILHKVKYNLSEPNVLLLDIAQYKTDDETEYQPIEYVGKVELYTKNRYSLSNNRTQPWVIEQKPCEHTVTLRYIFNSEIELSDAFLATEDADECNIIFNGKKVENKICGYFTDKAISKIPLPKILLGQNVMEITYPLGDRTNVEACFILGNFGVRCEGIDKTITAPPDTLAFGDTVPQGLPFYGANITYTADIDVPEDCDVLINAGSYVGAVLHVSLDDMDLGIIAYSPYEVLAENVKKGNHTLSITLYGNRHNSFGPIHLNDTKVSWFGPEAWEYAPALGFHDYDMDVVVDYKWKYEYSPKPFGIMASPLIKYIK